MTQERPTLVRYTRQFCGHQGADESETSIDRVLCEMCGEPAAEER